MIKYLKILICILLLVSVRIFENELFYDPFLEFFKGNYHQNQLPNYINFKLFFSLLLRLIINLIISIALFHSIFSNNKATKNIAILLGTIQITALLFYIYIIKTNFEIGYLLGFYIRRIVIQPLIILIIIPLYYYQKKTF